MAFVSILSRQKAKVMSACLLRPSLGNVQCDGECTVNVRAPTDRSFPLVIVSTRVLFTQCLVSCLPDQVPLQSSHF